jgi:Rad3-related DNA helicase
MKRLPTTGASIATPRLEESKLKDALRDLGVAEAFDDAAVHELYLRIAEIHGAWLSEQEAKEVSPVAKALRSAAKNLTEASKLLSGHETGLRTHVEFEATSHAARIMALDPTVGSLGEAQRLISAFQEEATRIGHACMIAYADLARKASNDGRTRLLWYDDFTALLLEVARKAGVAPKLSKNRISRVRTGWLFEAAQALEPFLDPFMRSPSAEACGKRLERSSKRLRQATRQNPRTR